MKRYTGKRLKTKTKSGKNKKIIFTILIIFFAVIFFINIFNVHKDRLAGLWTSDGNTFYEFDGKGEGMLRVPSNTYIFSYTIKDDIIHIDFKSEIAKDSDYKFSVMENTLTIIGIESTTGTYTLNKQ